MVLRNQSKPKMVGVGDVGPLREALDLHGGAIFKFDGGWVFVHEHNLPAYELSTADEWSDYLGFEVIEPLPCNANYWDASDCIYRVGTEERGIP